MTSQFVDVTCAHRLTLNVIPLPAARVTRHTVLGGLIKEYEAGT